MNRPPRRTGRNDTKSGGPAIGPARRCEVVPSRPSAEAIVPILVSRGGTSAACRSSRGIRPL